MSMLDSIERGFSTVNSQVFKRVNRTRDWWHLPNVVALLNLRALRDDLRQFNLYDTNGREAARGGPAGGAAQVPHLRRRRPGPDRPGHGPRGLALRA